ncbi:MAG TPA: hypothetical protein O0X27_05345, partial [Methanocorpusculum sp.]|nr:hypothetical protein [Methanocorpusculum sp.]
MAIRESIYNVINISKDGKRGSLLYNLLILLVAIVNLFSVWAIMSDELSRNADIITACTTFLFLFIDYILRWITADFKLKIGRKSFLLYPFTLMAIVDLLALIPVLAQIGNGVQLLKCLRFFPLFHKLNPKKFTLRTYAHGINDIAAIIRKLKVPFISASIFVL